MIMGKRLPIFPKVINYISMLRSDTMSCLTTMIDASLIGDSRFATGLDSVEDYPFMLYIIKKGECATINSKILATYRRNSLSKTKYKANLIKKIYRVYRRNCHYSRVKSLLCVIRFIFVKLFRSIYKKVDG